MTWRPFVVFALMFLGVFFTAVLIWQEKLPDPSKGPQAVNSVVNPLFSVQYTKGSRRQNFETMGMEPGMANAAANWIGKFEKDKDRYLKMMDEDGSTVSPSLCGGDSGIPQPYSMLEFLVKEASGKRTVIEYDKFLAFESQPWYRKAPIEGVFNALERDTNREPDTTVMGVVSLLLSKEADAIARSAPWGQGALSRWGFGFVKSEWPKSENMVVQYFALMHYLAEIANGDDGICN